MARSGRFGRLPRNAPDLTGTIVALLREYQAQRERNVVDAWKNGGTFEGKKATDQMVLDFYEDKMEGLDHDDPLYEEAKNTHQQYEFAVANSKMELKYAQGKVGAGAMARFYRQWAGKLPRNSEAWRQLMKSAAGYADHARSSAASGARSASNNAYYNRLQGAYNRNEAAYDMVSSVVQSIAEQAGFLSPGETLAGLRPGQREVEGFFGALNAWNTSTDPDIVAQRRDLTEQIRKFDKDFSGDFSYASVMSMTRNKQKGVLQRLDIATRKGNKTDVDAIKKELATANTSIVILGELDEFAEYELAREEWETVRNNPLSDSVDINEANMKYQATLRDLQSRTPVRMEAGFAGNYLAGGLQTEIDSLNGISSPNTTWFEDAISMTPTTGKLAAGEKGGEAGVGAESDAESTAASVRGVWEDIAKLQQVDENGNPMYALSRVDGKGNPVGGTAGPLKAVPVTSMQGPGFAYTAGAPRVATLPDGTRVNINSPRVYIGQNIGMRGVSPLAPGQMRPTSALTMTGNSKSIGERYDIDGGETIYGYWTQDGHHLYSTINPFVANPTAGQEGLEVNVQGTGATVDASAALLPSHRLSTTTPSTSYKSFVVAQASTLDNGAEVLSDPANRRSISAALRAESGGDEAQFNEKLVEWGGIIRRRADTIDGRNRMMKFEERGDPVLPVDAVGRSRAREEVGAGGAVGLAAARAELNDTTQFPDYARARIVNQIDALQKQRDPNAWMKTRTPAQQLAEKQRQLSMNALQEQLGTMDRVLQQQRSRGFGWTPGQAATMARMYAGPGINPRLGPAIPAGLRPAPPKPLVKPPEPPKPKPPPKYEPPKTPTLRRRTDLNTVKLPTGYGSPTAL